MREVVRVEKLRGDVERTGDVAFPRRGKRNEIAVHHAEQRLLRRAGKRRLQCLQQYRHGGRELGVFLVRKQPAYRRVVAGGAEVVLGVKGARKGFNQRGVLCRFHRRFPFPNCGTYFHIIHSRKGQDLKFPAFCGNIELSKMKIF